MFGFNAIEGAVIIAQVVVAIIFYPRCLRIRALARHTVTECVCRCWVSVHLVKLVTNYSVCIKTLVKKRKKGLIYRFVIIV